MPALLMVMPYTAIQFTVLHKLKTFASGSSKTGNLLCDSIIVQWTLALAFISDLIWCGRRLLDNFVGN